MLKGDLKKLQQLAEKNRKKAIEELAKESKIRKNPKDEERRKMREDDNASSANKLFKEMKERDF